MRAAVTLLASLGICAGSGGCGDGGAGPADPDRSPARPPTPTVAFLSKTVGAPEGGSAVLRLTVAPPPESPITVGYSIGVDDDASTYDADAADYALQSLVLANNRLAQLPERAFSGLSTLGSLNLAGNRLSELPPGLFSGLSGLWWLELSGNPIEELPPAIFAGLSNLSGLVIANTELSDLRAGMFVGLTKLRALDLRANPATPFRLPLRIARIDNEDLLAPGPAEIAVQVAQGAPFPTEVVLHIDGAALHVDTLDIETGSALGEKRTIAHDSGSVAGTRITVRSATVAPEDIRGVEFEVADPIVLFAAPSRVRSVPPASGAGSLHRATLSSPASGTALAASPARRGRTQHRDWSKR